MSWQTIRPQIATLIDSLALIQEVSSTPKLKFTGYPAAHVVPSDLASAYETNTENLRVYAFIVRVFYETKANGVAESLDKLEEAVDQVIDALDQEDRKGSSSRTIAIDLPADYTYLGIEATPGIWGELPSEQLLFAEVNVRVKVSYDAS